MTLFFIQVALARLDLHVWLKFGIASLGTIGIALIAYEVGVRYTPIGTMLNGKKHRGRSVPRQFTRSSGEALRGDAR